MGVIGIQAWVTSAVTEKAVTQALILGGSLRRARTANKLVVIISPQLPDGLRDKLLDVFDLVLPVQLPKVWKSAEELEEFAKVQAWSLQLFQKCVYLAPHTLVVKNCDDIFDKLEDDDAPHAFVGRQPTNTADEGDAIDSDVFAFSPSLVLGRELKRIVEIGVARGQDARRLLHTWFLNNYGKSQPLQRKYNVPLRLPGDGKKLSETNLRIVNFTGVYPIDLVEKGIASFGPIEKFVVNLCRTIYVEDIRRQVAFNMTSKYDKEPIAIVGMSFQFPGGSSPSEFWELLVNGREGIGPLPAHRWTRAQSKFKLTNRNIEAGFLSSRVDEFDGKFFGMSPKEVVFLDPQQRLLHEVSWEALEDAGIDPLSINGTRTGIFVGSWNHDYRELTQDAMEKDVFRSYMGNSVAATAARLSHYLGVVGPSIGTETGCSSAMLAVDLASKSLRSREIGVALAGGVNLFLHPFSEMNFSFVVSPDGRCKTFDAGANGFGRAEGCAVLVLKRMSDALRDGDRMWGLIRGSAVTQEGLSKSLGTPTVQCEALAMELALKDGGVAPSQVSVIETHGTGTPVGDPLEVAAVAKAYGKGRTEKLAIGSVKTNIGHTESVAGLAGMIKILLAMKHEVIPPHRNLVNLNPDIDLDAVPAVIPLEPMSWPRIPGKPRLAGVSSFGISGSDAHVIVEEAPAGLEKAEAGVDFQLERPLHFMKVSAKCPESLEKLLSKYGEICEENSGQSGFQHFAFSANTGRAGTFPHRAAIVAKDFAQAAKVIRDKTYRSEEIQGGGVAPICFLFTGQGSQYPGMAEGLYSTSPVFRNHFDDCCHLLEQRYGIDIKSVLWKNSEELSRTLYSQTAIFCVEYCLLRLWESWGVKPDFVLGHSLGEFAAAVAAGAIGFEDALMLVAERSRLIDNLPRGKMLVIKADKRVVEQTITQYKKEDPTFWADYAALNSPDQTVIAGDSAKIEEFAKFCQEKASLKAIILAATHAFHSRHMDPMLDAYRRVAATAKKQTPGTFLPKYISGMEGKLIESSSINEDYWVRHTRDKVSFMDACKVVQSQNCSIFIEVGPHPVLSALAMANIESSITCLPSLRRKEEEWTTLLDSVSRLYMSDWSGEELNWKGFDSVYPRQRVPLPFYPFNRKPVWIQTKPALYELHPLLGTLVPTAVGDTLFENLLSLKMVSYVKDHVIGDMIVFPGAGFLEMCLAGGHAAMQGLTEEYSPPRRPLVLRNLKIASPLGLTEGETCILQTVISLQTPPEEAEESEEEMGYSVNIHRRREDTAQWVHHASAKVLQQSARDEAPPPVDISSIIANSSSNSCAEFYERLPSVGLRFGPKFQSLVSEWREEDEKGVLFEVKVPEDQYLNTYLLHPVVTDAMIQAAMLWASKGGTQLKKLHVPVHIDKFTWFTPSVTDFSSAPPRLFLYTSTASGLTTSLLLDSNGSPLAQMEGVEFLETSVTLLSSMIQQQENPMPALWEESWKEVPGSRMYEKCFEMPLSFSPESHADFEVQNDVGEEERCFLRHVSDLGNAFFVEALTTLGWVPEVGRPFPVESLMELGIAQPHYAYLIHYFLRQLCLKDNPLLEMLPGEDKDVKGRHFVLRRLRPQSPAAEVAKALAEARQHPTWLPRVEYRIIAEQLGPHLADILSGKADLLTLLFPEESSGKVGAGAFYEAISLFVFPTLKAANVELYKEVLRRDDPLGGSPPVFRFLEIGAGTGSATTGNLEFLTGSGMQFEYVYTDVSAAFFAEAERRFAAHSKNFTFRKLDIDKDPLEQGFVPHSFDIIFGLEVMHVSKKLREAILRLRTLLKPGGFFQFFETVQADPIITFVFGLLEGYWAFEDKDIRPFHATLPVEKWAALMRSAGFANVDTGLLRNDIHGIVLGKASEERMPSLLPQIGSPAHSWLVFSSPGCPLVEEITHKLKTLNRAVVLIEKPVSGELTEEEMKGVLESGLEAVKNSGKFFEGVIYSWGLSAAVAPALRDQTQLALPFLTVCQGLLELDRVPRVFAVTQGAVCYPEGEVINPAAGTVGAIIRTLNNEYPHLQFSHLDLDPGLGQVEQVDDMFSNLWGTGALGGMHHYVIAYREGKRLHPKFAQLKLRDEYLPLPPGCDRFQLAIPASHMISDVEFTGLEPFHLAEEEVEIQTKAVALNFRDILTILKPIAMFDTFNTVGLDVAGVVVRIGSKVTKWTPGDRVFGLNMDRNLAVPSHLKVHERALLRLPPTMTFAEGSTLPAVYMTSIYCLLTLGKMKKGETVLVHTATGGVGLSAIEVAKYVGANVIATAGSPRKRNYLRKLGIKHVFDSRSTEFGAKVLEVTKGRGVDIVLNSLTGQGFKEASLGALAKNGRFLEMSKLNIWSAEEVAVLRPDVFYSAFYLGDLSIDELGTLLADMEALLEGGTVKPVPYERFDALNIRGALNYLQKAKHIGKIVCIMPELRVERSKLIASTPTFNSESTYLVTGGLGGIGFAIIKWMLRSGAKHIVIATRRSGPPPGDIAQEIEHFNSPTGGKAHVVVFSVDIGNRDQVQRLFSQLAKPDSGFPPLRGVMHCAGVLKDALVTNQSWSHFDYTCHPKIEGSWNLHDLTKDLSLEFFLMFSSITALFGTPGQANHCAANSFEDALVYHRKSACLPAATINWGNWGEVGVATEIDFPGVRPISTLQALAVVDTFLKTGRVAGCVSNIDSFALLSKVFPLLKTYVEDKRLFGDGRSQASGYLMPDKFWEEMDAVEGREGRMEVVKRMVKGTVRTVLKLPPDEEIGDNVELQVLGIDSLMMLEMKNALQNILGSRVTLQASQLKDCNTAQLVAERVVDILDGQEEEITLPSEEELRTLVREDSKLLGEMPNDIPRAKDISEVEVVLLTGVTGTLGPYMLKELSHRRGIKKIICLIRKSGKLSPKDRLEKKLTHMQLLDQVDLEKVECVAGDIAVDRFELNEVDYTRLVSEVDAVVHCAILADHTAKYYAAPESRRKNLRNVNVLGTQRVLQLCAEGRLKHIFYASSILALTTCEPDGRLNEGWQEVGAFDEMNYNAGYVLTKHVAELLLRDGVERLKIPAKVVRLPFIGGDSKTGQCDHSANHLLLRCLTFMKLGVMPDTPFPIPLISADICAQLCLRLFFHPDAPSDVYNVAEAAPPVEQELASILQDEFGTPVDLVGLPAFLERLNQGDGTESTASLLAPFKQFYEDSSRMIEDPEYSSSSILLHRKYVEEADTFFRFRKALRFLPEMGEGLEPSTSVLRRDLRYLKKTGVFELVGITT